MTDFDRRMRRLEEHVEAERRERRVVQLIRALGVSEGEARYMVDVADRLRAKCEALGIMTDVQAAAYVAQEIGVPVEDVIAQAEEFAAKVEAVPL